MKITIVSVTYNCAAVLGDCLESVKTQSYDEIEHIVIDGASTDGTLEIVKIYGDHLALWVSEPDFGIYDAMNKGIRLAKGEVIGFLNSDDFYASNSVLARVASTFASDPLLEACYSDLIYTDQFDTFRTVRYWKSKKFFSGAFSKTWCPPHPTFFVRRSVYERLGMFDLSFNLAADFELMMRFLEVHKIRALYVSDVWVKMRLGGSTNKSMRNILRQNQEILRALQMHGVQSSLVGILCRKIISRAKQFFLRPVQ